MENFGKIVNDSDLLEIAIEAVLSAEVESGLTLCYISSNGQILPPLEEDYDTFAKTIIQKIQEAGFMYNIN